MLLLNQFLIHHGPILARYKLQCYNREGNRVHADKPFNAFSQVLGKGGCPEVDQSFCTFNLSNTKVLIGIFDCAYDLNYGNNKADEDEFNDNASNSQNSCENIHNLSLKEMEG